MLVDFAISFAIVGLLMVGTTYCRRSTLLMLLPLVLGTICAALA